MSSNPKFKNSELDQREREQDYSVNNQEEAQDDYLYGSIENKQFTVIGKTTEYQLPQSINRPSFVSHSTSLEIAGKTMPAGLYYHGIRCKNGKTIPIDEWICSPLIVDAVTISPTGDNFGRLLKFIDTNNQWRSWSMSMCMLKGAGEDLLSELLSRGFIFLRKKRNTIIDFIMSELPTKKVTITPKVGWHNSDTFVLPNQVFGKGDEVIFQIENATEYDFASNSTIEDWKYQIGRLCKGNIPLMVSVCTALAGVLLKRIHRKQGGAVHWVGDSSTGKSTALEVAATVWGSPEEFVRSWRVTSCGFEGIAARRNDTCLILDEINEVSSCEIGKIVYMLVNGVGKQRAGRMGTARQIHRWRLMGISSGERTLESIMHEAGKQPNAGQLVRLLNIPSTFEHGIFSELHEFDDGRSLADHLKKACQTYYGHLGPAYVQKLIDDKSNLNDHLDMITKLFLTHAHTNLEKRAASTFALIALAGEIAIRYGLLPWEIGDAIKAVTGSFRQWQKFQGASQTEDSKILEAINNFICKHGDSRFSRIPYHSEDKSVQNRAGWHRDSNGKRIFMFTPEALQEAGGGYDKTRIVDTLNRYKWITDTDMGRLTKKTRTPSGAKNLYHICIPDPEEKE